MAGAAFTWDKGDGGPALNANLMRVEAVAHGPDGDVYIGDGVGRIRKIDAVTGIIDTVAGIGVNGFSGDGGPATSARIGNPTAIRFDGGGNLYFSDCDRHVVRKVDTDGVITTVVGTVRQVSRPMGRRATKARIEYPYGLAVGADGVLYVSTRTTTACAGSRRTGRWRRWPVATYRATPVTAGPPQRPALTNPTA